MSWNSGSARVASLSRAHSRAWQVTVVQHGDPVRQLVGLFQILRGQEHGGARGESSTVLLPNDLRSPLAETARPWFCRVM